MRRCLRSSIQTVTECIQQWKCAGFTAHSCDFPFLSVTEENVRPYQTEMFRVYNRENNGCVPFCVSMFNP